MTTVSSSLFLSLLYNKHSIESKYSIELELFIVTYIEIKINNILVWWVASKKRKYNIIEYTIPYDILRKEQFIIVYNQ